MSGEPLFWFGISIYALFLLFALYMTRAEQVQNQVSLPSALVGFVCCVFWPATLLVMAVTVVVTRDRRHTPSE